MAIATIEPNTGYRTNAAATIVPPGTLVKSPSEAKIEMARGGGDRNAILCNLVDGTGGYFFLPEHLDTVS